MPYPRVLSTIRSYAPGLILLTLWTVDLGIVPARATTAQKPASLEEVERQYQEDRRHDREVREPLLTLGERQLSQGQARQAVATLRRALESRTLDRQSRGRTLLAYARAQAVLKERSLALAALELVLRDGPDELASEAQLEKALLESERLLTPSLFLEVLHRLSLESPLTLDFDLLQYLVGTQRGYRLDQVDLALRGFELTWSRYPKGPKAKDALLHQALIEGLVLSKAGLAWSRIEKLAHDYPGCEALDIGRLLQATLSIAQGDHSRGLDVLSKVKAGASVESETLFLKGLIQAYYLDSPDQGLAAFDRLENVGSPSHYALVAKYHRALILFAMRKDPAGARKVLEGIPAAPPRPVTEEERGLARLAQYRQQLESYIGQSLESRSPDAHEFSFATFWYANHHFGRALASLEAFLAKYPDSPLIGRARMLQGKILQEDIVRPEEARQALTAAQPASPVGRKAEIDWRVAKSRQGEDGAQAAFGGVYRDQTSPFRLLAGVEKAREGQLPEPEKRKLLSDVASKEPSGDVRAKLITQLAKAYLDSGNPRRALEVYQSALPFDSELGPEIRKARTHLEIQQIEGKLARAQLLGEPAGDGTLLLHLGRLLVSLDRTEEAKKAFRAAVKSVPPAKGRSRSDRNGKGGEPKSDFASRGSKKSKDVFEEKPLGPPVDGGVPDQARLELMKLQVKAARFPTQALRHVHQYLETVSPNSLQRLEALSIKVDLLEKGLDSDNELVPLCRFLVDRGYQKEKFSLKLAQAYVTQKKLDRALAVLVPLANEKEVAVAPEALLLQGTIEERLGKNESTETYRRLAIRWPKTSQGKDAGGRHASQLARGVERALSKAVDKSELSRTLETFLGRMRSDWVPAVRSTFAKLSQSPYIDEIPLPSMEKLIDLIGSSKDCDRALLARFQGRAAQLATGRRSFELKLEQALSLAAASDSEKSVPLLLEVAPHLPRALLHVAIIQERDFKDPQAALTRLDELLARSDVAMEDRAKALLRKSKLSVLKEDPAALLEKSLPEFPKGPQRALILERLSEIVLLRVPARVRGGTTVPEPGTKVGESSERTVASPGSRDIENLLKAARFYQQAAASTLDMDEKVRLSVECAKALMDAGEYQKASLFLKECGITEKDSEGEMDPRILTYFLRSEAFAQLSRLEKVVNWDDPESPTNLQVMLTRARLLISPLKEYDKAKSQISQIEGLFPQAPKEELDRLRHEMSHRWSLMALEDKQDKLPRDLMQLAVTLEEELSDYASAARYLRELLAIHPTDPLALIARFRLIRLYTLRLNRKDDAARLAGVLQGMKESRDFKPEISAAIHLVVAQDDYQRALAGADEQGRSHPNGSFALIQALTNMGRIAVFDFRDQALAADVLKRLMVYSGLTAAGKPSTASSASPAASVHETTDSVQRLARVEIYRLAMAAAVELSPLTAAVYALSERASFLETALLAASNGQERARVLLEQGFDRQREQDLDRAAVLFDRSSREAPSSPFGREALLQLAKLREGQSDLGGAKVAYTRLSKGGPPAFVKLASKKLPQLENLVRSSDREIVLAQGPTAIPSEYYNVGRQQMDEDEDFEKALVNFRTYLRVGRDQKNLVDAYLRSAELLARLNRPKEALDTLERVMARYPKDGRSGEMCYKLALLKEVHLADLKAATEDYRKVKKGWPRSKWAQEADKALARIVETQKERQRSLEVGTGKSTVASDIRAIRKKYIDERGSVDEAIAALKGQIEATTTPSEQAALYLELATIYDKELKQYLDAVTTYEKFLECSTDLLKKGDVQLRVAELKSEQLKEPEEALELYQQFSTKFFNHPRRIDALLAMANLQEKRLNDVQAAINIYRNIADSYPRSGYDEKALMRIAELSRTHFADYTGAIEALRRLVRDYPFSTFAPYAQLQVANILEVELGDKTQAMTEYQRLIDAYPQSPYADGARQALVRLKGH